MSQKRYLEIQATLRELSRWDPEASDQEREARNEKVSKLRAEGGKLIFGLCLEIVKQKKSVTLRYSGSGDWGGVDEITPELLEGERELIEALYYDACWDRIRGYENNDGGGGTVTFRLAGTDRITVEHEHFDSTEEWSDVSSDTSACPEAILEICRQLLVTKVTAEYQYEDLYIEVHGNREAEVSLEPHLAKIVDRVQEDCDEEEIQISLEIDPIMGEMTVTVTARELNDEYQNWTFEFPE